jgi:hypothetical protein
VIYAPFLTCILENLLDMKRQGEDRQAKAEDLEAMDEMDDFGPGVYSRADAGTLASRKILKAKRQSDEPMQSKSFGKNNPFASTSTLAAGGGMKAGCDSESTAAQDSAILKRKMTKLNENFLRFMEKNPNGNWKDGLQVKTRTHPKHCILEKT